MSVELTVEEICDSLRALPDEQLDQVLQFLHELEQAKMPDYSHVGESLAPLYRVHTAAVRTGIPDLAHQHDHYLYGLDKRNG